MVKELLIKLGYDNNSINKIIAWHNTSLEHTLYNYIINTFEYLKSKGYSEKEIIQMTKKFPTIFSLNNITIEDKFNYFKNKGYSEKK